MGYFCHRPWQKPEHFVQLDMQKMQQKSNRGFTLIELLVTLVIAATAIASVALAMPSNHVRQVEKEESRLEWVIAEAHATAQRHRIALVIARLPNNNGYQVINVPPTQKQEPWAQPHECECSLTRLDTTNPAEPLQVPPDALLPHFQWRIDVKDATRILEHPSRAS